jgi:hypothetical protein
MLQLQISNKRNQEINTNLLLESIWVIGLKDIGRHFYENGPKKGWELISNYLQKQIDQHNLSTCDAGICAMHLKALLEAEVVEPYALGVIPPPDENQLIAIVSRAITVFLRAYQP